MTETSARRLPKAERREQLLETALEIVREEGTDALTLGHVAERAGVTKPIAYEHFKTRSGLLVALYERMDELPRAKMVDALERTSKLPEIARVASQAYIGCYTSLGPEWYAVSAALAGSEEMEATRRACLANYAEIFRAALAPHSKLSKRALYLRCVGIIGAAEGMAQEMLQRRTTEAAAVDALTTLITSWIAQEH
ncbi:TetR/AcrR family transcriptional regulator [Labilithrix luteola]|nr:TetR/AcrR family transcriptional regulator [Labilithrix luteola]